MEQPKFELPEDWGDPLAELHAECQGLPEDIEDQWAREHDEWYASLTEEERIAHHQRIHQDLERFQQPDVLRALNTLFRNGFTRPH